MVWIGVLADMTFQATRPRHGLLQLVAGMGMAGLFLLAALDSSIVPLPVPGATDILLILLAARQHHWILMAVVATAGSVVGGGMTYHLGKVGGMHTLEKRVPKRQLGRITGWTERNGFLAVALPAILPPPMPLTPFLLAAGVLKVKQKTFYSAFTLSRAIRHGVAAWLGYRYGRHILRVWNSFSQRWSTPLLVVLWTVVIAGAAWGIYQLVKRARHEAEAGLPTR